MSIGRSVFEAQRQRRFGTGNPERMPLALWENLVRAAEDARTRDYSARRAPGELGTIPSDLREYFGLEVRDDAGPIWTFERMGATRTPHPDGRLICVGGEYEDFYDPDFCIYNDVASIDIDGSVEIYGYPEDLFPPTDFHSATLLDDRVILVGRLGYHGTRHPGETPVFSLDLRDYRIKPLPSAGDRPGWIFKHEAELNRDGVILIRGGQVVDDERTEQGTRRNFDDFAYDPRTGIWRRLTTRNWRQFSIADAGGKYFMRGPRLLGCNGEDLGAGFDDTFVYVSPEALAPRRFASETVWSDEPSIEERFLVEDTPVNVAFKTFGIEIVIEGDMGEATAQALVEDIKDGIEAETGRPCVVREHH